MSGVDGRLAASCQDWALRYASLAWRVYPIGRGSKKALFTGWVRDASTDRELISRQWRREPYPNVGVICGEAFAVFDIEGPHLSGFFRYIDELGCVLPETPIARSGRCGLHIYVQAMAAVSTTRNLRLGGVNIGEFKTSGGVVAPPSVTSGEYRWLWWPDDPTPTESPEWLSALIAEPSIVAAASRGSARFADPAVALDVLACKVRDEAPGNRNNVLFWASRRAAEEGIRADIAQAVLRRVALASGLDAAEVDATIASGFSGKRVPA